MSLFNIIFDTSPYKEQVRRQKATLIYALLVLMVLLYSFYAFFVPEWGVSQEQTLVQFAGSDPVSAIFLLVYFGTGVISYGLLRLGRLQIARWGPIMMWFVPAMLTTIFNPLLSFNEPDTAASIIILVLLAGILVEESGTIIVSIITIFGVFAFSTSEILVTVTILTLQVLGTTALMIMFNRIARTSRSEGEQIVAQERLKLAELNSIITRRAAQRASLQDVLDLAVTTIIERYNQIYHAQIFLITDNGVQAKLFASTGEAGKALLEREHSLAVGSLSVIGQTTLKGQPVIEYAGSESVHRYNELLGETAVEAAFPLRVGTEIIGALDLQSLDANAFNGDDLSQFQSLADSLSLVIDNVRQFEAAAMQVQENQRLAEQARHALDEVKRLNKRLIGRAWSEYLRTKTAQGGLNVNFQDNTLEEDGRWTSTLARAAQDDDIVQDNHIVAIPLRVRGQVIGAMEFELDENQSLRPEDLELIDEISERFGLAAENSRLVEESQRSARRETLINQISARLQANNTIEATLTEAARSLSESLNAGRVSIRLGKPQQVSANGTNGQSVPKQNGHNSQGTLSGGKDEA
jgi:GAF domain-containing protein